MIDFDNREHKSVLSLPVVDSTLTALSITEHRDAPMYDVMGGTHTPIPFFSSYISYKNRSALSLNRIQLNYYINMIQNILAYSRSFANY